MTNDIHECEIFQERINRLQSGIAIISIGANTEIEMIEKKHRIEDSLEAVKSALEEGIIPGGGCILARLSQSNLENFKYENENQKYGIEIIKKSCEQPFYSIVENTARKKEVLFEKLLEHAQNVCYDALREKFVEAHIEGILDPAKTVKQALLNAASVASTLITADYAIVEK